MVSYAVTKLITDDCSDTKNELTCPITNPIWHLYEP